ncbi:MAG: SDR family oxidoreductase [Porticoccaceae bacterium]|nr:SDR family oxidoreductase [Porticoccaceae bacterium]
MSLKDKRAVVLGCSAAGGSGWAIAEALAKAGAKVLVAARSLEPLKQLAEKTGGLAQVCDAANPQQVAQLARTAQEAWGGLDIAVNCAALPVMGLIADSEVQPLQQSLDVNYLANVHFVRHMAAIMGDGGSIILISSSSAAQPVLPNFAYACAKAASDCLVRYAALEYGPRGIRVNSILPGPIKSDLARFLFEVPGMEEAFAREVPLGRIGLPADYADAVLWLCGPAYVTGLNLPVSGGNQLTRSPRPDELPQGETSWQENS